MSKSFTGSILVEFIIAFMANSYLRKKLQLIFNVPYHPSSLQWAGNGASGQCPVNQCQQHDSFENCTKISGGVAILTTTFNGWEGCFTLFDKYDLIPHCLVPFHVALRQLYFDYFPFFNYLDLCDWAKSFTISDILFITIIYSDQHTKTPGLDPAKLNVFKTVKEITGENAVV